MLRGSLVSGSGFLPIGLAQSATGEYTRSIFEVSAIALLLSWLAAVTVIPLLGYRLLSQHPTRRPADAQGAVPNDIYVTKFYRLLRGWVGLCVDPRALWLRAMLDALSICLTLYNLEPAPTRH